MGRRGGVQGEGGAWSSSWKRLEMSLLLIYAVGFYILVILRSIRLANDYAGQLPRLQRGWILSRPNDISDSQWRNFRGNLLILTPVMGIFTLVANLLRSTFHLRSNGMAVIWFFASLSYLLYLHGACILHIFLIATINFIIVKIFPGPPTLPNRGSLCDLPYQLLVEFVQSKYFSFLIWIFNLSVLLSNRVFEGYTFSSIGESWSFLDNYRGTFRWHICFNFVILRMISFSYDYHWACRTPHFDKEKHLKRCAICSFGKTCYVLLQEKTISVEEFSFVKYLCYLIYAPLYVAGPIISFNAFASQLDTPQKNYSVGQVILYGLRWFMCLFLMEVFTHYFYYNSFATSGLWRKLSPLDIFIIGYGVLNFMWLKFLLIWRYFRLWSLIGGIEAPENMPRCINNCYTLESFWKNWHGSFNKWLVRYIYIPLGGSQRKILCVWVIFTFVALWHDLEWKLISWAWLTCIFMIPEIIVKSTFATFKARNDLQKFVLRELSAVAGAITITCLMVTNLVGYVIGPTNISALLSRLLQENGLAVLGGIFTSFYVGTKLMFHINDAKLICA